MKIFKTTRSFQKWRASLKAQSVGVVPTMGALHDGHMDLVRRARRENKIVIATIFVNPLQFGPKEDLSKYPRTLKRDLKLLKSEKVDAVFAPNSIQEIYPRANGSKVTPPDHLNEVLEGQWRPGHFVGVCTVVMKLFGITQPSRAYFGEKDFQQLRIIEEMVKDFFLPLKIIRVKTRREKTGLAMSSRNAYLDKISRKEAAVLFAQLKKARTAGEAQRVLKSRGFSIDYLEPWSPELDERSSGRKSRWLAAVRYRGVRLIDNVLRK